MCILRPDKRDCDVLAKIHPWTFPYKTVRQVYSHMKQFTPNYIPVEVLNRSVRKTFPN